MAATVTQVNTNPSGTTAPASVGNMKLVAADVLLDSSYPTGGYTVTPAQLGLADVVLIAWSKPKTVTAANVVQTNYNEATNKLQAFTTSAEVANTTDLSAVTARLIALGY